MIMLRNPTCFLMMVMYVCVKGKRGKKKLLESNYFLQCKNNDSQKGKNEEKHSRNLYCHLDSFFLKTLVEIQKIIHCFFEVRFIQKRKFTCLLFWKQVGHFIETLLDEFLSTRLAWACVFFFTKTSVKAFLMNKEKKWQFLLGKSLYSEDSKRVQFAMRNMVRNL